MLKTIILAAASLLLISSAHAITPQVPDCSKTIDYEKNLLDKGYKSMMIFTDKLNENTKEEFLYDKETRSIVLLSHKVGDPKICVMFYGEGYQINPDINVFRDFLDDTIEATPEAKTP